MGVFGGIGKNMRGLWVYFFNMIINLKSYD